MPTTLELAKNVIELETQGINALHDILNSNLEKVINVIASCKGHVIITGIGKSGNIATKISASMSSVGIPSFFLEPSNAGHGDMGMITKEDAIIAISNSGESHEITSILNYCHNNGIQTIAITRSKKSTISNNTDLSIAMPSTPEAHALNAPTTSTTQTLVLGDILAVCASALKNFQKTQYAKLHPGGNLGMKISKVTTILNREFYSVMPESPITEVLTKMTEHSNGFVCVVKKNKLYGIITDGDIRRFILNNQKEIKTANAYEICNKNPKFITNEQYIIDAVEIINKHSIGSIIIVDNTHKPIGFISRTQFKI